MEHLTITESFKNTHKCEPIYLNVLLLNKDELVTNKIAEKTGTGFFGRAAARTANHFITDEKIASNIGENLVDGVSKALGDMGITADFHVKFKQGAYVVLRIQIDEMDIMKLVVTAKGPQFANSFQDLLNAANNLGMGESVGLKVKEKIYGSIGEGMVKKFNELIPKKMEEKGVIEDCQACLSSEQAEIFFAILDKVNGK
jgi:hypothetical protein